MSARSRPVPAAVSAQARREHLSRVVRERGAVRTDAAAADLGLSSVTIPKDLAELDCDQSLRCELS